jgi:hypothetical protein
MIEHVTVQGSPTGRGGAGGHRRPPRGLRATPRLALPLALAIALAAGCRGSERKQPMGSATAKETGAAHDSSAGPGGAPADAAADRASPAQIGRAHV